MSEILACPYCPPDKSEVRLENYGPKLKIKNKHWAYCATCFMSGPTMPTEAEAVEAWNEVAGMVTENARLREALAKCSPFHDFNNHDPDHPCAICSKDYWQDNDDHSPDCLWWHVKQEAKL